MMLNFKFEEGQEKQVQGIKTSSKTSLNSANIQVVRPIFCTIMYMLLSKLLVLIGTLARRDRGHLSSESNIQDVRSHQHQYQHQA